MNKKIIVGIVIIAILLIGGYFVFSKKTTVPAVNVQQNTLATTTTTTEDTSTWKTYKNEKYGFEFKYPSNLNFKDASEDPIKKGVCFGFYNASERIFSFCSPMKEVGYEFLTEVSGKVIPIAGKNVSLKQSVLNDDANPQLLYIHVTWDLGQSEGFWRSGEFWFVNKKDELSKLAVFNQILSTFKFTK